MDTFVILIREIMNDVHILEWNKYSINVINKQIKKENLSRNGAWRLMETMGPTQTRNFVPHGILLQFRIHWKPNGSWMS